MPVYEPSKRRLTWPNGVVATTFSGDEFEQLRGPQHRSVLIDELPKFANPEELFDQMDMGLRIGDDAACIISTTPLPIKIIKELYEKAQDPDSDVALTTGSTMDNAANLGKKSVAAMVERYKNTVKMRQEIYGEIIWESESSFFRSEDIEKYRVDSHPPLVRTIVAVDPAVTSGKNSDDTGITVGGICAEGHVYVFNESTMKGTPSEWATRVDNLFTHYDCDAVVCEKNQGGDLLTHTIQSQNPSLPVKLVTATKGKLVRAEPISLFFEQGRIHIVGHLPKLEQEMVEYDGSQRKSPDSYDSFIWLASELLLNGKQNKITSSEFLL